MIIKKNNIENNFYINISLSFFDEKTEKPTGKRKSKARSEGNVANSKEVTICLQFIIGFLAFKALGNYIFEGAYEILSFDFPLIGDIDVIFNKTYISRLLLFVCGKVILICLPIALIIMTVGIISNVVQVKWKVTLKPLKPKFSKFNPIKGMKKLFSMDSIVEFLKSLAKMLVIIYPIYSVVSGELHMIQTLLLMDLAQAFIYICNLCIDLGLKVGLYFIIVAVADYAYTKYKHFKGLKMSKQEVKDEHKQVEGDPHVKGKIRNKMMQISMRRMMQEVPNADVIITNPTHYAVALKYEAEKGTAPVVVAKGVDHLAKKIKDAARENNVEIVENRPLARALYNTVEIGNEIPPELYQAVAEVLAYIYRLKNAV